MYVAGVTTIERTPSGVLDKNDEKNKKKSNKRVIFVVWPDFDFFKEIKKKNNNDLRSRGRGCRVTMTMIQSKRVLDSVEHHNQKKEKH